MLLQKSLENNKKEDGLTVLFFDVFLWGKKANNTLQNMLKIVNLIKTQTIVYKNGVPFDLEWHAAIYSNTIFELEYFSLISFLTSIAK